MKLEYKQYDLKLKHIFKISRSSRDIVPVIIVKIVKDGVVGYGEASPNARYEETMETVKEFLDAIDPAKLSDPFRLEAAGDYVDSIAPGNPSANCAVDIALHDWICKRLNVPLYEFFNTDKDQAPVSVFTIGIDTPDNIVRKVKEAVNYPILKIKLGVPNDEEIVEAVRRVTDKPLRVDANEGWKSKEEALEKIKWLSAQNVELIEQPMPASQIDDMEWLRERVSQKSFRGRMPVIADEALSLYGVSELSAAYDGINIKLQKNGGLVKTRRLIHEARNHNMKIMLGCMIETSVGITAAARISPLVDWNDVDGNLLISNDPLEGVRNEKGRLYLSDKPGLGVSPNIV